MKFQFTAYDPTREPDDSGSLGDGEQIEVYSALEDARSAARAAALRGWVAAIIELDDDGVEVAIYPLAPDFTFRVPLADETPTLGTA